MAAETPPLSFDDVELVAERELGTLGRVFLVRRQDEAGEDRPAGEADPWLGLTHLVLRALVPEAVERISWGMPTFDLYGKHLLHFAGYARHVGFYPMPGAIEAFKRELASYKTGKGSVQLPLDRPLR